MKLIRTISTKLLKISLWLFYLIVLLQIAGFIYFQLPSAKPIGGYGYPKGLYVYNKIGYGYRPNYQGRFIGGSFRDVEIRINQHGFRDDPFERKQANVKRVLFVGDSIVLAPGVKKEDRFTEKLKLLVQNENNIPVEIFNLGINSYASRHYLALLKSKVVEDLHADAVIVGLHFNDIYQYAWPETIVDKSESQGGLSFWKHQTYRDWLANTYASIFLQELQDRFRMYQIGHGYEYYERWLQKLDGSWSKIDRYNRIKSHFQKIKELSFSRNSPLLVIVIPELSLLSGKTDYLAHKKIVQMLQELQIPHCDLNQFPPQDSNLEQYYLPNDNTHLSAKGHDYFSGVIYSCMRRKLSLFTE